jgi:broad specificity phosphatase PhoE
MERLILARHGESAYSAQGLVNGDAAVDVGLTPAGEEQARALGRALAGEPIGVCVVSALPRTRATAELALAGRTVPIEARAGFDDPGAGRFEGRPLDEYRGWAWSAGSGEDAPGGGESRRSIVARYADAYRGLLDRAEAVVLAVLHALPIAYALDALDGSPPAQRIARRIAYAQPVPLAAADLRRALDVIDAWREAPTW